MGLEKEDCSCKEHLIHLKCLCCGHEEPVLKKDAMCWECPLCHFKEKKEQLAREMDKIKTHEMLMRKLDEIPEMFTDGIRGILLLRRSKDGEEGNAQRKAIKKISRDTKEWKEAIREFSYMQHNSHQGYRIYSSVNSRDCRKAIHEFKKRQLENDYANLYEHWTFYCDIKNRFFSCLMNPNTRATNNFLIDCDTPEEYEFAKLQLQGSGLILLEYATINGHHILTRPFNPNDYGTMQIKKDGLLYVG